MRNLMALLVGAFCFLGPATLATPASATVVITQDGGGIIDEFVNRYETIRASGDTIVVDGICASACTLMLGIVPEQRICATPRGVFGFHSASEENPFTHETRFSYEGTRMLWQTYPWYVRQEVIKAGWNGHDPHPVVVWIAGTKLVQPCSRAVTDKLDIPFPIKFGWTWHFPPQPYDPNAPIEQPDTETVEGKPLHNQQDAPRPVHHSKPVHHRVPKPAPRITAVPTVAPPVVLPSIPSLPKVSLPQHMPDVLPDLSPWSIAWSLLERLWWVPLVGFAILFTILFIKGVLNARKEPTQ